MRVIHLARSDAGPFGGQVEPLCGEWGGMDTDWTYSGSGVTCEACRGALRVGGSPAPGPAAGPALPGAWGT